MERPPWLIDELAHAGEEHRDPRYVASYDRKAGFDPTADVVTLPELGLNRHTTLVDVGAGTGELSLTAAPYCRRVVAIDVSAPMLQALATKVERLNLTNVEVIRAGFLTYEHHGAPADFVYSRNALHHLPDFWKALALERLAALLRPGGVLRLRDLVYACNPGEVTGVFDAWLANAVDRPENGWTREELEVHVREEYSTFTWLLEPMFERVGFRIQQTDYSASRTYAAYTCVRG